MQEYEKIIEDVSNATATSFWMTIKEKTIDFPDIGDAAFIKEVIIERAISLLVIQWFIAYSKEERRKLLDGFIKKIKYTEHELRDYEVELPDED